MAVNNWVTSLKVAQDCAPKLTTYFHYFTHIDFLKFSNNKMQNGKNNFVWQKVMALEN